MNTKQRPAGLLPCHARVALLAAAWGGAALLGDAAPLFTAFHSFGDSLTDSGHVYAATGGAQPYPTGRFSNGPTWAEQFPSDHLGLSSHGPSLVGGNNHAWGGAWTGDGGAVPTVLEQVAALIIGGQAFLPTDLVSLWAGANDFLDPLQSGGAADGPGRDGWPPVAPRERWRPGFHGGRPAFGGRKPSLPTMCSPPPRN